MVPKQTISVKVGAFAWDNGTALEFRPNNISAKTGDVVRFDMLGMAHSVTQSSFSDPCQDAGLFDTDLQPNPLNESLKDVQNLYVTSNDSAWFFCKQKNHCQKGMVFAINPKSDEEVRQFIANAIASNSTNTTAAPPGILGTGTANMPGCASTLVSPNITIVSAAAGSGGWNASTSRASNTPPVPTSYIGSPTVNSNLSTTLSSLSPALQTSSDRPSSAGTIHLQAVRDRMKVLLALSFLILA